MQDVLGVRALADGTDEARSTLAELDRVLRHVRAQRIDDTARVRADLLTRSDEASVLPVGRVLAEDEVAQP